MESIRGVVRWLQHEGLTLGRPQGQSNKGRANPCHCQGEEDEKLAALRNLWNTFDFETAFQTAVGDPSAATFSTSGGDGHYTWSLQGDLPDGLTFSNGKIAGTPTKTGTFSGLVATVQDGTGAKKNSNTFSIEVSDLTQTVSSSQANLVLSSLFSPADWQSEKPKRVVIPSGVVIYSDNPANAALSSGTNWGGDLTLQISSGGQIQGAGGSGVAGSAGRNGGDAILVQKTGMTINNNGSILAGGAGGKGADGQYSLQQREPAGNGTYMSVDHPLNGCFWHPSSGQAALFWKDNTIGGWGGFVTKPT